KGFSMKVIDYDVVRYEEKEQELGVTYTPLDTLLQTSDFISIHTPLTPQTYHLIGEKELKMMKKTAVLVNTARGPIIDENALVKALKEGWIFSAGLDVFEKEPALTPGLADLPNVVIVPHIGSASVETRSRMAEIAAKNLILALQGKEPLHRVV
ncbi:MAG: NAD(P)-dependent oxidoreductase, partial [bacterium]